MFAPCQGKFAMTNCHYLLSLGGHSRSILPVSFSFSSVFTFLFSSSTPKKKFLKKKSKKSCSCFNWKFCRRCDYKIVALTLNFDVDLTMNLFFRFLIWPFQLCNCPSDVEFRYLLPVLVTDYHLDIDFIPF